MASGSRQSGLESRSDSTVFDPSLTSWMSRDPSDIDSEHFEAEDESKKKEKDPEGEIRELFRLFDKNHDNTISSSELGKMLACVGMEVSDVDVAILMKELDRNGNGKIEYREFKSFIQEEMRRSEESPQEQGKGLCLAFRVFDCNEDGAIDTNDLKSAMKNLGEPLTDKEFDDMIKDANINEDGKINYEDIVRVWLETAKE